MPATFAFSTNRDPILASRELVAGLGTAGAGLVIFFASTLYDPQTLAKAMADAFPKARTCGCTTAGEIVSGYMLRHSVVAMALGPDVIAGAQIGTVTGLRDTDFDLGPVFRSFELFFQEPVEEMDTERYVGLVLVDGLSMAEERIMDRLGDRSQLVFLGGSAGDDLAFQKTHVFADGQALSDAALFVLLKTVRGFHVLKSQSFEVLDKALTATRVDETRREVMEFDGEPAALAYARALGLSLDRAGSMFRSNPLGLMVGNEPYVRSPQQFKDQSMIFFCTVVQGMELHLLQSGDIVEVTRRDLDAALAAIGHAAGCINFNCILRTLELDARGQLDAYARLFATIPTVGFSTYGEEYIGHINQTATMLLLK